MIEVTRQSIDKSGRVSIKVQKELEKPVPWMKRDPKTASKAPLPRLRVSMI